MPHRKRILLSDEGFRTLLLESLHEHGGFHVFHAREEHEVMETIQCHKPHILLLDDMLPHKGGLHVLRQLRERGHRLSTILMTVLSTQKIVRDATELGASYVFPKPFFVTGHDREDPGTAEVMLHRQSIDAVEAR